MSTAPVVPKRPTRSPNRGDISTQAPDLPEVPPRPQRPSDGPVPEDRESSARSPLNAPPSVANNLFEKPQISPQQGQEVQRAPSVASLPLIGQEGIEYASLEKPQGPVVQQSEPRPHPRHPHETRNVAGDLPLHAPKASASPMTQKSRVAAVTRTDTEKASVAGIGKPKTEYNVSDATSSNSHYRPPSAVSTERPSSTQAHSLHETEQEQGIPAIGETVPLYPNAGDVQAPTPAPPSAGLPLGELSRPGTTDGQRRSAHGFHGFHGPPGSYGLHGHGLVPHDKFEKAWYEKHPEELAKEEEGAHHPAAHDERPPWALSSDELNKLVHRTGRAVPGMGTHPDMIGTPTEAIGYQASEEYASRAQSPQTTPPHSAKLRSSRPSSQSYVDSPLKKTFSASDQPKVVAAEDRVSDDDRLHVMPPKRPQGKYSGAGYDPPTENLGPEGGNTDEQGGWVDERGDGVPILASDETKKYPAAEWMQPAVSPAQQMAEDEYFSAAESDHHPSYQTSRARSRSKGQSRPSSLHSHSGLSRYNTHEEGTGTPLEEIEEYEPLFNDDDTEDVRRSKVLASRLKHPDLRQQHFPSRDIWEDAPNSSQLETTVETPEPTMSSSPKQKKASTAFEPPEKEQLRKAEFTEPERQAALREPSLGVAKPKFNPAIQDEIPTRPGMRQRFPSRDIWEDTPDSLRLETTIGDQAVNVDAKSPESVLSKPTVPARPTRSKAEALKQESSTVPSRPQPRDAPTVPDRPKPSVPQRPARSLNKEPSDPNQLPKTTNVESAKGDNDITNSNLTSALKIKPAAPARPAASSKFASIKAGFMSDLNSRLSKGPLQPSKPQQEKDLQTEEDKVPLSDARKGRARGPARRKPAASPTPATDTTSASAGLASLEIAQAWTVWSVDSSRPDTVEVSKGILSKPRPMPQITAAHLGEQPMSSPLATNTAGEPLLSKAEAPQTKAGHLAHQTSPEMDARAHRESEAAKRKFHEIHAEHIGFQGDVPEPILEQAIDQIPLVGRTEPKENDDVDTTYLDTPLEAESHNAQTSPPTTMHVVPSKFFVKDEQDDASGLDAMEAAKIGTSSP